MSEDKNIEEKPEDYKPPLINDGEKSAEDFSISPIENKTLPDEEPQPQTFVLLGSPSKLLCTSQGNPASETKILYNLDVHPHYP